MFTSPSGGKLRVRMEGDRQLSLADAGNRDAGLALLQRVAHGDRSMPVRVQQQTDRLRAAVGTALPVAV